MQGNFIRATLLFGVLLIFAPLSWGQDEVVSESSAGVAANAVDSGQTVAVRKMIYGLCKQQPGAVVEHKEPVPDNSGVVPGKICFTMEFKCKEKGSSGYSDVYQTTRKCFDQKIFPSYQVDLVCYQQLLNHL